MSANPLAIYDRFDPAKNYDRHLFRADKVLQSAELNEVQRAMHARLAGIAGILMKEGSIISGAGIIVNHDTGATTCESGAIYVAGAVRGVPPAALVCGRETQARGAAQAACRPAGGLSSQVIVPFKGGDHPA